MYLIKQGPCRFNFHVTPTNWSSALYYGTDNWDLFLWAVRSAQSWLATLLCCPPNRFHHFSCCRKKLSQHQWIKSCQSSVTSPSDHYEKLLWNGNAGTGQRICSLAPPFFQRHSQHISGLGWSLTSVHVWSVLIKSNKHKLWALNEWQINACGIDRRSGRMSSCGKMGTWGELGPL